MDIQPKLGGVVFTVVKIRLYFGYKISILRDNGLKFGRVNDITIESFENIQN